MSMGHEHRAPPGEMGQLWLGVKVVDGHDYHQLEEAFRSVPFVEGKPSRLLPKH